MVLRSATTRRQCIVMEPAALPTLILIWPRGWSRPWRWRPIILVVADVVWSRVSWQRELRMSARRSKDEMKAGRRRSDRQGTAALLRATGCASA